MKPLTVEAVAAQLKPGVSLGVALVAAQLEHVGPPRLVDESRDGELVVRWADGSLSFAFSGTPTYDAIKAALASA